MATTPIQTSFITEDDLMAMGSNARIEIINGEIVSIAPVGGLHVFIVNNLYDLFNPTVRKNKLGYVFTDGLIYKMSVEDDRIQGAFVPDFSFIRKENLVRDWDISRPYPGVPDFAVEVLSPSDSATETRDKIREYLDKGTEEIWIIYPRPKEIHQYRHDEPQRATIYAFDGTINVSSLFPDIIIKVADVFDIPTLDLDE